MKTAFYIGTRPGMAGSYNRLVRWWESGVCSHVELVFTNGMSASASLADGGVRFKAIDYNPDHWVMVDLGNHFDEDAAWKWFTDRVKEGAEYDLAGQMRFVISPIQGDKRRYWCSEAVAAALGMREPWRYGPNLLKSVLMDITNPAKAGFFTA